MDIKPVLGVSLPAKTCTRVPVTYVWSDYHQHGFHILLAATTFCNAFRPSEMYRAKKKEIKSEREDCGPTKTSLADNFDGVLSQARASLPVVISNIPTFSCWMRGEGGESFPAGRLNHFPDSVCQQVIGHLRCFYSVFLRFWSSWKRLDQITSLNRVPGALLSLWGGWGFEAPLFTHSPNQDKV